MTKLKVNISVNEMISSWKRTFNWDMESIVVYYLYMEWFVN